MALPSAKPDLKHSSVVLDGGGEFLKPGNYFRAAIAVSGILEYPNKFECVIDPFPLPS